MDQNALQTATFSQRATPSESAASITAKGQLAIVKGDLQEGLRHFSEAQKLDPNNPYIYYAQGLSLFEHGNKRATLLLASKKFKTATALDPHYFDAWQAWGSVLLKLGLMHKEHHYFIDAQDKVLRAIALAEKQPSDILAELYLELGSICMHLANFSGEACDLHQAINAFQKVQSHQPQPSLEFWMDFGKVNYKFAQQINDPSFHVKAIGCLKSALVLAPTSCDSWILLGDVFQSLYLQTHDEDHFTQANDCYLTATKIQPDHATLWFAWANFLCQSSRTVYDLKRLRASVEKCHRAFSCNPDNPKTQAIWAEALAMLGSETERLDIIYDAQNRISQVLEITEDLPEIWYSYGMVLKALGHYFDDFDYYYQAIEKFQEGLTIDRTCHAHWHAIGQLYTLLGDQEEDAENLQRAFRFYQRAIDLHPSTYYIVDYAIALCKLGEIEHEQKWLEEAVQQFERAFALQKNASYIHPDWLFQYACVLDTLGDFYDEDTYYSRAIEILSHVLMIEPDFPSVHHRLSLALAHLGELTEQIEYFYRAIHHLRISAKQDEENEHIILDWASTLINIAYHSLDAREADQFYLEAEHKLWGIIRLGNTRAYYHLACLYSLLHQPEKAMQSLHKAAHFNSLPSMEEIIEDEWLDNIRATGDFIEFLSQLEERGDPHKNN